MKIKEIAKLAGVSTATISRVINESPSVKEETRQRILKIIKEKKYKPNVIAQNLAKCQTNTIGVVIPDLDNPFFGKIINGISEKIEKNNLNIILLHNDGSLETEEKMIEILIAQRVTGAIIVPVTRETGSDFKHFNRLDEFNIPYVFIDREIKGENFSKVYLENREESYEVTKKLLEKTDDVGIISGPLETTTGSKRLEGYQMAMEVYGKEEKVYYGDYKMESGYKIIIELIKNNNLPKALFIANNMMTLGVIKGLIEKKIKISKDIFLFSFDEVEMAEIFGVKIDYLKFDVKSIGEKAVDILIDKLNGDRSKQVIKIKSENKR